MSNPAATPCIVEDREGDGRWMSMVTVVMLVTRLNMGTGQSACVMTDDPSMGVCKKTTDPTGGRCVHRPHANPKPDSKSKP